MFKHSNRSFRAQDKKKIADLEAQLVETRQALSEREVDLYQAERAIKRVNKGYIRIKKELKAETQQVLSDAAKAEADVWRMYILHGGMPPGTVKNKYKEWFGETKLSADEAGLFCERLVSELDEALKRESDANARIEIVCAALQAAPDISNCNTLGYVAWYEQARENALKELERETLLQAAATQCMWCKGQENWGRETYINDSGLRKHRSNFNDLPDQNCTAGAILNLENEA
ncbi:MAG: hypothetical protein FVQ79_04280 [Planctomycetes bacterium]|nr:hypothetical protein [Planctomycetota bacterium]